MDGYSILHTEARYYISKEQFSKDIAIFYRSQAGEQEEDDFVLCWSQRTSHVVYSTRTPAQSQLILLKIFLLLLFFFFFRRLLRQEASSSSRGVIFKKQPDKVVADRGG